MADRLKSDRPRSVEEDVVDVFKKMLDDHKIVYYSKTHTINNAIKHALASAPSKSGGTGGNYPDIKLLLVDSHGRIIPVMIEAKGAKGKLEKVDGDGMILGITLWNSDSKDCLENAGDDNEAIDAKDNDQDAVVEDNGKEIHKKGQENYRFIQEFAVNGALHYGKAILDYTDYKEVIIIGVNGYGQKELNLEMKAYYLSKEKGRIPIHIPGLSFNDLYQLSGKHIDNFFKSIDALTLSKAEIERLKSITEKNLEKKVKAIHQSLYNDVNLKTALSTNEKLYLFCGLIMAGLKTPGISIFTPDDLKGSMVKDSKGNILKNVTDGGEILDRIEAFLTVKNCSKEKIETVCELFKSVFAKEYLSVPVNGESMLKQLYRQVYYEILPCFDNNFHLDFAGKILNSLNDWVQVENDRNNDVVLTPRYVTKFMASLAKVNRNSHVWDSAMGSGGFLVSAMEMMIKDAEIHAEKEGWTPEQLAEKIRSIKENQILGIEILGNIYILAILNMILMGDGCSMMVNEDSGNFVLGPSEDGKIDRDFPADVFLLNPPYSAEGKGLVFLERALSQMGKGKAVILIQESAGSGQGIPFTQEILKKATLKASIKMPRDLFSGKASVNTYIFVFDIGEGHKASAEVLFVDFSNDGYVRQNRKKSSQDINLRNADHAVERYAEVVARVLGDKPERYNDKWEIVEEGGSTFYEKLCFKSCITLNGDDWTIEKHKKNDEIPAECDFRQTVADYLAWKVGVMMKAESAINEKA